MAKNLEKTQELISYLVAKHQNPSVTVLMKLCYLVDLVSIKRRGEQVTGFEYIRYKYGPFDRSIYQCLEDLEAKKIILSEQGFAVDNDFIVYKGGVLGKPKALGDEEVEFADRVLGEMANYGAKALTDIAYKTRPMVAIGATRGGEEGIGMKLDLRAA